MRNITNPIIATPSPIDLYLDIPPLLLRSFIHIMIRYLPNRRKSYAEFQLLQISLGSPLLILIPQFSVIPNPADLGGKYIPFFSTSP